MPPSFPLSLYHHQKHKQATPPMKNHHRHLLKHRPPPSFLPTLFHHQRAATPIKWPKNCQRLTVLDILGLMYGDGRGEKDIEREKWNIKEPKWWNVVLSFGPQVCSFFLILSLFLLTNGFSVGDNEY